jgi:hypothetical protein
MTVAFDQITIRGRNYPIRGTVTQALESEGIKGEVAKIGAGAGVGAIIGGIIGGAKGALIGVLIGAGGTIAATEGKDVSLPTGTSFASVSTRHPTSDNRRLNFFHRIPRRFDRLIDVARGVRTGQKPRFKLEGADKSLAPASLEEPPVCRRVDANADS